MIIARIIRSLEAQTGEEQAFQVEVRHFSGAASRWPEYYSSYEDALAAARESGADVLLGWRDEHVWNQLSAAARLEAPHLGGEATKSSSAPPSPQASS